MTAWVDALGWLGSAMLIVGLLQRRMGPLRVLSMAAAVVLVLYNALIASWPMVAMNVLILGINLYRLLGLRAFRGGRDGQGSPAE